MGTIKSYRDLRVYQSLYANMVVVLKDIVPGLPVEEKFDLCSQLRRCCKSSPALIAEGFAKRYQKRSWKKYLEDCIGECNEMVHHLSVCIDIYPKNVDTKKVESLTSSYDIIAKQLYKLRQSWCDYHANDPN